MNHSFYIKLIGSTALILTSACGVEVQNQRTGTRASLSTGDAGGKTIPLTLNDFDAFITSADASSEGFDMGRKAIANALIEAGHNKAKQTQFTKKTAAARTDGDQNFSTSDFAASLTKTSDKKACFVYLSSYGLKDGLYVSGESTLKPETLDEILSAGCTDLPTVVLISSCFAGTFSGHEAMQKPNRVIYAAADFDKRTFRCHSDGAELMPWDQCMVDLLSEAKDWQDLQDQVASCVEAKEIEAQVDASMPKLYIGESMKTASYPFAK